MPNLSELGLSPSKPVVERSVSENEAERQNYRKLQLKMERRIKNREKLMAMKRYSGFLKRPEILGSWKCGSCQELRSVFSSETVYSVEEEEPKQKSEEKNDEETANTKDGNEGRQEDEEDGKPPENEVSTVKKDEMSETTEYDCSTDDSESLRLIYSSTDQSNCCSGIIYFFYL